MARTLSGWDVAWVAIFWCFGIAGFGAMPSVVPFRPTSEGLSMLMKRYAVPELSQQSILEGRMKGIDATEEQEDV